MGIMAILPIEVKGTGICSEVYTDSKIYIDQRTPTLYLDNWYRKIGKRKKEMDEWIYRELQISKNTPYVFDQANVFFGFKHRIAKYDKQGRGFVNVRYVDSIADSEVILTTGDVISTLNTFDTLNVNKNNAKCMMSILLAESFMMREDDMRYVSGRVVY